MAEEIFCLRPKYLDDFKCDGAACGALCCRSDWDICVDAATYEKYLQLGSRVVEHLRGDESGEKFSIVHDGACPFLGADNLCSLQKTFGEDYLSQVCASYPRIITRFENFLEVALSPTCPVAARLVLLQSEPLKFEVVAPDEKFLRLGANNILQGVPHDFAPLIIEIQLAMVAILQERRLSLDRRLIVLGFLLDRIEELFNAGELTCAAVRRLSAIYSSGKFLAVDVPLMLRSVRFMPDKKKLPAEFSTVAENFLVNEIFLSVWPFRLDAGINRNFEVFAAVYKIFRRRASGVRNVDELLKVAGDLSCSIDHDEDYLQGLGDSSWTGADW